MKQAWTEALRIDVDPTPGYPCVRLAGEGEPDGARHLEQVLRRLVDDGQVRIILDTRDLRFLDQQCYDVLQSSAALLEDEGGMIVVVDASLPVERSLKLLDVERLAHVVPSVSQATAYLEWHE